MKARKTNENDYESILLIVRYQLIFSLYMVYLIFYANYNLSYLGVGNFKSQIA